MDDQSLTRRRMLGLLGSTSVAIVAGFDPIGRRWISEAEASQCPTFADVPHLDGLLLSTPPHAKPIEETKATSGIF
jgi:cytokinin dehydrogenase